MKKTSRDNKKLNVSTAVEDVNAIVTARGDTLLGRACIQTSGQKFVAGHRRIIDKLLERATSSGTGTGRA